MAQREPAPAGDPDDEPPSPPSSRGPQDRADMGPRILAATGWTVFLLLAIDRVGDGPLTALDPPLLDAVPHEGPIFAASSWFTALGDPITLAALTLLGIVLLLARSDYLAAAILAVGQVLANVAITGLKQLFGRLRPGMPGVEPFECCAFPSGHATGSAMVFMLLAVLLFERHRKARPWAEGVAVGVAVVVAATRVVLLRHWPTDVVAGLGLGWGLAGALLLLRIVLERNKPLPNLAPEHDVSHTVGLCLPQGVDVHEQTRVAVHVEDVAERGPTTSRPHPLHP